MRQSSSPVAGGKLRTPWEGACLESLGAATLCKVVELAKQPARKLVDQRCQRLRNLRAALGIIRPAVSIFSEAPPSCPRQAAPHVDYIWQGVSRRPAVQYVIIVDGLIFKVVGTKGQYFSATRPKQPTQSTTALEVSHMVAAQLGHVGVMADTTCRSSTMSSRTTENKQRSLLSVRPYDCPALQDQRPGQLLTW